MFISNIPTDSATTTQSKYIFAFPNSIFAFLLITCANPSGATGTIFAVIVNVTPKAVIKKLNNYYSNIKTINIYINNCIKKIHYLTK